MEKAKQQLSADHNKAPTATCSPSPSGLPAHRVGPAYANLEVKHRGEKAAEIFKKKKKENISIPKGIL